MASRDTLSTLFTVLMTLCLVLELLARVLFLGASLAGAAATVLLLAVLTAVCLWYTSVTRAESHSWWGLVCRVLVTIHLVLTARNLLASGALPVLFCWTYTLACLALSVVTAFLLERDLRHGLP